MNMSRGTLQQAKNGKVLYNLVVLAPAREFDPLRPYFEYRSHLSKPEES
jgi:hypothetical protein